MEKKKISLEINKEDLERICKKSETNITSTVKSALKYYEFLLDDIKQGKEIIVRDKEGKEVYYKFIL